MRLFLEISFSFFDRNVNSHITTNVRLTHILIYIECGNPVLAPTIKDPIRRIIVARTMGHNHIKWSRAAVLSDAYPIRIGKHFNCAFCAWGKQYELFKIVRSKRIHHDPHTIDI